jgi:hypothetical protein
MANNFALTIEDKRFIAAKKSGILVLNKTENFLFRLAEDRGKIEGVVLYCLKRVPITADFVDYDKETFTLRFKK